MSSLRLMNPHSVLAAIETRPKDVLEVHAGAKSNEAWQAVVEAARPHRIAVRDPIPQERGRNPRDGGRAGTTYAVVRERAGLTLEELFGNPARRGLWLALDQLQDPHNVGAIFRTAAFFGVKGIVLTVDRSAPLTATVYDVASGGLEHVPFVLQTNLVRAIEVAKKSDMWVLGSSEHCRDDVQEIDRDRRWLLLVGNEEKGLRRLSMEKCDQMCSIPAAGAIGSLNVSVAAGILMATLTRKP
ncbi:23S rRNA (guanosine(2251)-2'-O)-methyltransferase RlmB [Planctomicrobium sp. SH664]|uniref:23S rRNA (guanosine(2251)-2'-O)-methyltransferase RlmB n=1 Tax=Planctomicrobium sp. SH664 TaxID=3448125 RepID=UPI003F5BFFD5